MTDRAIPDATPNTMFKRILVTMDMSERGQDVFNRALSIAAGFDAEMMLLHVLSAEEEDSPLPIPDNLSEIYPARGNDLTLDSWREEWHDFEKQGIETLQSRVQKAITCQVKADFRQIPGSPSKTICQFAQDWQADLIVIGHRGRSGLSELILGSVSNYVLHHAVCSVLIVQADRHQD